MNWLDILLAILLVIAAVTGFTKGIIQQACGIVGLLLGVFLAHRFSDALAGWVGLSEKWATLVAFILILIVVILTLALIGSAFRKAVKFTGLVALDRIGGVLLSLVKYILIISLILGFWVSISLECCDKEPDAVTESLLYQPVKVVSDAVFPWILQTTDKLIDEVDKMDKSGSSNGDKDI